MNNLESYLLQADLDSSYRTMKHDFEMLSTNISSGMNRIIDSNINYSIQCRSEVDSLISGISSSESHLISIIKDCEILTEDIHKMEMLSEKMSHCYKSVLF